MPISLDIGTAVLGAAFSLAASWMLVARLERLGERFGLSEALLGLVTALAANAPEITSAISAVVAHQRNLGIGVILGSNVFNLAALLGVGTLVAGGIGVHRRVVLLNGIVAMISAAISVLVVEDALAPGPGFGISLGALALLVYLLASPPWLGDPPVFRRLLAWVKAAVSEEELELAIGQHPPAGDAKDAAGAAMAVVVVIVASVVMERSASSVGRHFGVPELVLGAVVLAAVTSLPNVVAAVHLAHRGRGAAVLSEALHSNTLNVVIGLLLPATIVGLAAPSAQETLVAVWFAASTLLLLVVACAQRAVTRRLGVATIVGYVAFVVVLVAT